MIVTVAELKTHLRIEHDEEDEYLASLIKQAQAASEDYCKTKWQSASDSEPAPEAVRLAVLLYASHFYEVRDNYEKQAWVSVEMAWKSLLWPHRDLTKMV